MGNLNGKRVLVTGAGQGLGYSITEHFVEAGANVAAHYFSSNVGANEIKALGDKKGGEVFLFQADLTKESEARALPAQAAEALGGLDILINNAGDMVQRGRRASAGKIQSVKYCQFVIAGRAQWRRHRLHRVCLCEGRDSHVHPRLGEGSCAKRHSRERRDSRSHRWHALSRDAHRRHRDS
jgi:NADP-dependent 3-hydroxy acid dehydrogenase YdfG